MRSFLTLFAGLIGLFSLALGFGLMFTVMPELDAERAEITKHICLAFITSGMSLAFLSAFTLNRQARKLACLAQ